MSPPSRRPPGELVFAALMLLLSAFLLWQAFGISGLQSSTSAGAFPMAAAATMLVCAMVIAVQAAGARDDGSAAEHGARPGGLPHEAQRTVPPVVPATVGAVAAYMLALEPLGFLPSSLVFLVGMTRLLGERRLRRNLLVSVLALGVIHLVLTTVFAVALPGGALWQGLGRGTGG